MWVGCWMCVRVYFDCVLCKITLLLGNADAPAVSCVGIRRHCGSLKLLKSVVCKEKNGTSIVPIGNSPGHLGSSA